jgi:peptidyl-prolyl cis-trans isomerase C
MKSKCLCFGLMSAALWAQIPPTTAATPPAAVITPDTVVATVEGKKFTAGDVRKLVAALPPQNQQHFAADPKEFLRQWVLLGKVANMAEKAKLDQQSPFKERLEYQRQLILSQAHIEQQFELMPSPESEWKTFYEKNKPMFSQAKLKVIYIPFNVRAPAPTLNDAPKSMTEAEAKTQAEAALAEIRKGTDFAVVVKKYSRDTASAAKGGDFGTMKRSDSVPNEIKTAIFATKAGETTAPIRHTNGYYLFRVDAYVELPFEQVKGDLERLVKQEKFNTWFEGLRNGIDIKIENQAFFAKPPAK